MNIHPTSLIPFLAHKDDIVRKKVAYYFLNRFWVSDEIRDLAMESFLTFDFRENLPILQFLEIQQFQRDQVGMLLNFYEKIKKIENSSRVLTSLKNIILNQPYSVLSSFENISLDFLGESYFEFKHQEVYREIFDLYLLRDSEEIWNYLRNFRQELKLDDDLSWMKVQLLLEVLVEKFSMGIETDLKVKKEIEKEIIYFFQKSRGVEKIDSVSLYFFLLSVDFFKIPEIKENLLFLFTKELPVFLYEEVLITLISFNDHRILEQVLNFWNQKKISFPAEKVLLNLFDYFPLESGESILLEMMEPLKNSRHERDQEKQNLYIDLLLKLADLFSFKFLEFAKAILDEPMNHNKKYLIKKNLLVYSIVTGLEIPENHAFMDSYIKRSDQRDFFSRKRKSRQRTLLSGRSRSDFSEL